MEGAKWKGTETYHITCGWGGWVGGGGNLVFRSKTNSTDYHNEMNSKHYMEWMTQQLLPRLEEPTVIILDNTSHHNKQKDKPPTTKLLQTCGEGGGGLHGQGRDCG